MHCNRIYCNMVIIIAILYRFMDFLFVYHTVDFPRLTEFNSWGLKMLRPWRSCASRASYIIEAQDLQGLKLVSPQLIKSGKTKYLNCLLQTERDEFKKCVVYPYLILLDISPFFAHTFTRKNYQCISKWIPRSFWAGRYNTV